MRREADDGKDNAKTGYAKPAEFSSVPWTTGTQNLQFQFIFLLITFHRRHLRSRNAQILF
jgi:hypothetical protein